jgi:hypothetical protein
MNQPIKIGNIELGILTEKTAKIINWQYLLVNHDPDNELLKFVLENIPKQILTKNKITKTHTNLLKNEESIRLYIYNGFNINWVCVSNNRCVELSEEFIEEFIDNLDLKALSYYQTLSKEFIIKYKDKLSVYNLKYNKLISNDIINEVYGL